jgi:sulfur-oxidizing protein SoxB
MTHLASGKPIDPAKQYIVASWASLEEGAEGPPVWELVERWVARRQTVRMRENRTVKVMGA